MEDYVALSLETHLFFARIMKEHSLFLEIGFPCKDKKWIKQANWFRGQFELFLHEIIKISNGQIHDCVLVSDELVTEFTLKAEQRTKQLTGIPIHTNLTIFEQELCRQYGCSCNGHTVSHRSISMINQHAISLLDKLIIFKENMVCEVKRGSLFTLNYPLLIEHMIREAKLYRSTLKKLNNQTCSDYKDLLKTENFWNQIMMEHALFIRGLLDPSEEALIMTADDFACDFKKLLEMAKEQDCESMNMLTQESLAETLQIKEFKTAGIDGILNCKISSILLPLLADHVLREANHYIRLLTCNYIE